jgi:hypothetical protein
MADDFAAFLYNRFRVHGLPLSTFDRREGVFHRRTPRALSFNHRPSKK